MRSLVGIFVGGAGRRMGGVAKGLLPAPSGLTLVEHLAREAGRAHLDVALVGLHESYRRLGLPMVPDRGRGPLAGLLALLEEGRARRRVVTVACDMPFLTAADLECLAAVPEAAPVAAARSPDGGGLWEPFYASYAPGVAGPRLLALALAGCRSFQELFHVLVPQEVQPVSAGALHDWDRPEDLPPEVSATLLSSSSSGRPE